MGDTIEAGLVSKSVELDGIKIPALVLVDRAFLVLGNFPHVLGCVGIWKVAVLNRGPDYIGDVVTC